MGGKDRTKKTASTRVLFFCKLWEGRGRRITGSVLGFEQENHDLGAGDGIGWAEVARIGGAAQGDSVTVGLVSPGFERMSDHVGEIMRRRDGRNVSAAVFGAHDVV